MDLTFKPYSESELLMMGLLEAGNYKFRIIEAKAGQSKSSGAPMITLKLNIIHQDQNYEVMDYLLSNNKQMLFKLRHCCECTGLMDKWEAGNLSARDFLNKQGYALVGVRKGTLKNDGTYFQDSNSIEDYIKPGEHDKIEAKIEADKPFVDSDDLPF